MNQKQFNQCIRMLHSSDPMTYENAYFSLQDHLVQYIEQIMFLMRTEKNPEMRAKFIELIGDSGSKQVRMKRLKLTLVPWVNAFGLYYYTALCLTISVLS